jgi:hypothetical protein
VQPCVRRTSDVAATLVLPARAAPHRRRSSPTAVRGCERSLARHGDGLLRRRCIGRPLGGGRRRRCARRLWSGMHAHHAAVLTAVCGSVARPVHGSWPARRWLVRVDVRASFSGLCAAWPHCTRHATSSPLGSKHTFHDRRWLCTCVLMAVCGLMCACVCAGVGRALHAVLASHGAAALPRCECVRSDRRR